MRKIRCIPFVVDEKNVSYCNLICVHLLLLIEIES